MADELIKIKKIKGKQNKKKWAKNVDVSGLLQAIEKQNIQKAREQQQPQLIVEETSQGRRPLDPQRFKNRKWKAPKPKYDNKIKKQDFIAQELDDLWNCPNQNISKIRASDVKRIPSVVKPDNGIAYNAQKESLQQIKDQIIKNQAKKPEKTKKIKKYIETVVTVRARNKNRRIEQLQVIRRKEQNLRKHQLNSYQRIGRQIEAKQKIMLARKQRKQEQKSQQQSQKVTGKITKGPKLSKNRYQYKAYLPIEQQLGKPVSKIAYSEDLVKQRFDTFYRKGMLEARNIKVHANRTKGIKVKENVREQ